MQLINQVRLLNLNTLKAHEKINLIRALKVNKLLQKAGKFIQPIIVDKNSMVILDGHHRRYALAKMGCSKIPALMVNYFSKSISVTSRRKNYKISKKLVIDCAMGNKLFPYKTTKHSINSVLPKINISLKSLKNN